MFLQEHILKVKSLSIVLQIFQAAPTEVLHSRLREGYYLKGKHRLEITLVPRLLSSQVHNLQKLKNISLKAVNSFCIKNKSNCLSENVFFHLHIPELPEFSRPCG